MQSGISSFIKIDGVDDARYERYGSQFLTITKQHAQMVREVTEKSTEELLGGETGVDSAATK